ncbi:hypothetical protein J6590_098088, partial [Homalodisca vitripennis]
DKKIDAINTRDRNQFQQQHVELLDIEKFNTEPVAFSDVMTFPMAVFDDPITTVSVFTVQVKQKKIQNIAHPVR